MLVLLKHSPTGIIRDAFLVTIGVVESAHRYSVGKGRLLSVTSKSTRYNAFLGARKALIVSMDGAKSVQKVVLDVLVLEIVPSVTKTMT